MARAVGGGGGMSTFPRCPINNPTGKDELLGRPRASKEFRVGCPSMAGVYQRVVARGCRVIGGTHIGYFLL